MLLDNLLATFYFIFLSKQAVSFLKMLLHFLDSVGFPLPPPHNDRVLGRQEIYFRLLVLFGSLQFLNNNVISNNKI